MSRNGGAPTGWSHLPSPQLSPSIATEAFQAASLTSVVGGPVWKTVDTTRRSAIDFTSFQRHTDAQGHKRHKPGLFIT